MKEFIVKLDEATAQLLEEHAREAGISVEDAIRKCVAYVMRELLPTQEYKWLRSQMFWEHYQHLKGILGNGGR